MRLAYDLGSSPRLQMLRPRLVNKVRVHFSAQQRSSLRDPAENMYPIIMISSSPTSLITMYNVRRFLQESMCALPRSFCYDRTDSNKYPRTPTDSSRQQRHEHALLRRVPLGQRTSYPSIGNVRQLNLVARHAQAPNDIMLSTRLRLSTSLAQTRGIVLSAFLQRARSGNSGLTNGVSHAFCSITVSVGLAVRGYLMR
jgi:hypothetical protein